jgi:hypothetical protein
MGAISKFIRDLDPAKDTEANLKETLTILVKLAETKLENFRLGMNSSWKEANEDSLGPGVTKDFQDEQMHVITSVDAAPLQKGIGDIVDAAFSLGDDAGAKNIGTFIKKLATQGLDLVLGSGSAEENQHKQYIIYPDGNFVCRCDVWYWRYSMSSKGFQQKVENVVVYRMQYGAIDLTKVSRVALAHWFDKWKLDPDLAAEMLDKMTALVDKAQSHRLLASGTHSSLERMAEERAALMKGRNLR